MSEPGPGDVWAPPRVEHPARGEPALSAWVRIIAAWYLVLAAVPVALPWATGTPANVLTVIGCGVLGLPALAVVAAPETFVRLLVVAACLQTGLALPAAIAARGAWPALAAIAALGAPLPLLILARTRLLTARSRRRLEELAEDAGAGPATPSPRGEP